jgi:hypothetical protein
MRFRAFLAMAVLSAATAACAQSDKVARGKYLVEEVGKCADCHTPRTDSGEPDMSKNMKGTLLNVAPINPIKGWHKDSPDITPAGKVWQRWTREGMVDFLVKGVNPRGGKADPPMPAYHLAPEDAEAMVSYLETLK